MYEDVFLLRFLSALLDTHPANPRLSYLKQQAARPFLTVGPLYARRGDKRAEQVVVEENGLGK